MNSRHHSCTRVALLSLCFLALASLSLPTAFAQYLTGPGAGPPTPPGTTSGGVPSGVGLNSAFKTPPLSSGQALSVPISIHNSSGAVLPNWAGVLVEVHLADPSEVDITAVKVGGIPVPNPFPVSGPGSTAAMFTVWHPAAFASGIALPPSGGFPAVTLDLVAKNTNPINNSDVDINLRFADIYHQPGFVSVQRSVHTANTPIHLNPVPGSTIVWRRTPGSTTWRWEDSHRVLVPSSIHGLPDLHLTAGGHQVNSQYPFPQHDPSGQTQFESKYVIPRGVEPTSGHFLHFPAGIVHRVATMVPFHLVGGRPGSTIINPGGTWATTFTAFIPGSQIFAMPFLATASIGIEHVPEPVAPVLLLSGVVSLAFAFRARRRRQQLT